MGSQSSCARGGSRGPSDTLHELANERGALASLARALPQVRHHLSVESHGLVRRRHRRDAGADIGELTEGKCADRHVVARWLTKNLKGEWWKSVVHDADLHAHWFALDQFRHVQHFAL